VKAPRSTMLEGVISDCARIKRERGDAVALLAADTPVDAAAETDGATGAVGILVGACAKNEVLVSSLWAVALDAGAALAAGAAAAFCCLVSSESEPKSTESIDSVRFSVKPTRALAAGGVFNDVALTRAGVEGGVEGAVALAATRLGDDGVATCEALALPPSSRAKMKEFDCCVMGGGAESLSSAVLGAARLLPTASTCEPLLDTAEALVDDDFKGRYVAKITTS